MDDKSTESTRSAEGKDVGLLFLANFVHQVVNPISGVIGNLDNVVDNTYQGEKAKQVINASRAQLVQCVSLIRNLAYLSDFFFETSEKDELRAARESATSVLPQIIIEAIQFFQSSAGRKNIKLELNNPSEQYRISARPELLRQIFINLFDNWIKYGLPNQTVEINVSANSKKDLCIELVGKSIGFSNNDAENIFKMGFRSREAHNKVAQGSGIGLFICRKITEEILEGEITASHATKTQRTTFRIAIPKKLWQL
ncbi:sensor histidine kinase [Burkholderia cenocepacia]|uniref:sensor histidine kinase n=2 Tax=Burkholderia cenocepacia TaxID=95486 RepID=UPI00223178AE|nr:HAMP domain-containing sensor histidine kinase [Burkholderia cenocepacia]MCW3505857.1 HAMP domain-containing histidine kinase [Burkholderia cenocepacia]MCW3513433.1 HAMP domain-containing histidine kinase [Burkholderia cenocepacia]MCW3520998.1 HAMP domain-containing histidine kinase [Burkholderia cenocepacia]MCW3536158.1 HAMP domain-containing histidine kinase [Burkholderia cenocepacia]MCW3551221.1 HAMP domain-containing histidine kinase [Burkholderia cenocepacia]